MFKCECVKCKKLNCQRIKKKKKKRQVSSRLNVSNVPFNKSPKTLIEQEPFCHSGTWRLRVRCSLHALAHGCLPVVPLQGSLCAEQKLEQVSPWLQPILL